MGRTIIILAGGLGSRLGSDKALRPIAGKSLIRHVVERVMNVANELIVVVGREQARTHYEAVLPGSTKVMNDELEGKSPLVGLVTGFRATTSEYAAVLTCDVPLVNGRVIDLLFERALGADADAAVPRWKDGRLEPLEAVYRTLPALREAEEALSRTELSSRDLIMRLRKVTYVSVEEEIRALDPNLRTFFNANTREDMLAAEELLAREHSE